MTVMFQPQKKVSCALGEGGVTVLDCWTMAVAVTGRMLRPAKFPPDTVEKATADSGTKTRGTGVFENAIPTATSPHDTSDDADVIATTGVTGATPST